MRIITEKANVKLIRIFKSIKIILVVVAVEEEDILSIKSIYRFIIESSVNRTVEEAFFSCPFLVLSPKLSSI